MAGWCARFGTVTPDGSLYFVGDASLLIGLEIFNGNRVVLRIDGDLLAWGLYVGSVSSRLVLSLNDRWLLLGETTLCPATAPYTRTWRALTPVSPSAKMKLCSWELASCRAIGKRSLLQQGWSRSSPGRGSPQRSQSSRMLYQEPPAPCVSCSDCPKLPPQA